MNGEEQLSLFAEPDPEAIVSMAMGKAYTPLDEIAAEEEKASAAFVFAQSEKVYDLGYGHLGNGLTVWNRAEIEDGDYKTIAHIAPDRTVSFYSKDLPDEIRAKIEEIAATDTSTISATQDAPVFSVPPREPRDVYPSGVQTVSEFTFPAVTDSGVVTISCEWSESTAFEEGKTYSVAEFDRLMKEADEERVAGKRAAIEKYGSEEAWYNSDAEDEFTRFYGYDKVKFTITLPDGRTVTERQDVGDGFGGVIDYCREFSSLHWVVPFLEAAVEAEKSANLKAETSRQVDGKLDKAESTDEEIGKAADTAESVNERRRVPDFHILDENLGAGGPKEKFRRNIEAVKLLHALESEGRSASPEEQEVLSKYVGWGGLADAFDETKEAWKREYEELKTALTSEEYTAAASSVLNAHFTSPVIIQAIYSAVEKMGFTGGKVLEPAMGIGNFFGCMPEKMREKSELHGVELDELSGKIAKHLYPSADVKIAGFETTSGRDIYDLVIGNVPFGDYSVYDKAYNSMHLPIHDYFFVKALDQVKPGGIMALVTSRWTLDKKTGTAREYLAKNADFLGAVRLPDTAFRANAGAEVVTDILFFQKRGTPRALSEVLPETAKVDLGRGHIIQRPAKWYDVEGGWLDGSFVSYSDYYKAHPSMMLGIPGAERDRFGKMAFVLKAAPDKELSEQLEEAVSQLKLPEQPLSIVQPILEEEEPEEEPDDYLPKDPKVQDFSYCLQDGKVYYQDSEGRLPFVGTNAQEARVAEMIRIRDCVRDILLWETEDTPENRREDGQWYAAFNTPVSDEMLEDRRQELNALYDSFSTKYGLLNDTANERAFVGDSSYFLLAALEHIKDGKLERKADIFTQRTVSPATVVTHVDTAQEAVECSMVQAGRVDLLYMAQLMGKQTKDIPEIIESLHNVIYKDPDSGNFDLEEGGNQWGNGWQLASEYLSGNIRKKLEKARAAAENYPEFAGNVIALQQAMPKPLEAAEIDVRLGATWIPLEVLSQFIVETWELPQYQGEVDFERETSTYTLRNARWTSSPLTGPAGDGTQEKNALELLEDALNLKTTKIYKTIYVNGNEKKVVDDEATILAQQKQQIIKTKFQRWIWADQDRRRNLTELYNEKFNSFRPRTYDGSALRFPGKNPEISLYRHQKDAIARCIFGDNTLLAHKVGAGKTFEMIAAAMERKRLGLCHKPLIVVPNNLIVPWATEFYRLYPNANILVATERDFAKNRRKTFCARIATGNYDAVIMGHSQLEKLPVSMERQKYYVQEQLDSIEFAMDQAGHSSKKSLARTKKRLEVKLQKLQDIEQDDTVTFEDLGVDMLLVDEAHNYKNLFLYTKMTDVAGISTTDAKKSSDMLLKCRYIQEKNKGGGVVFATGTPAMNSVTEIYTMQRYLQPQLLEEYGWENFDAWVGQFAEIDQVLELAPEGKGYRTRTRFKRFSNLPELMSHFREVADIKTEEDLELDVPEVEYITVSSKPTETQRFLVEELSKRAEAIHQKRVTPDEDNMLAITSDGRKLGLDQRLINPNFPDEPGTKVNKCVSNVFRIWQEGRTERTTQLIFCDISTPRKGKFNVYDDIRQKLLDKGIPENEIAFIHDYDTQKKKDRLFSEVQNGNVRILLGSTFKLGTGVNVQDKLIATHDLDCPWRPGDLEQRSGRIIRQGNTNKHVQIYRYVTEGTFDAYLWQMIENKQKFTSQVMSNKNPVRSCEDLDERVLSYAEIKAICAGDPRIKEKMELDVDVARLTMARADYDFQQHNLEDDIAIRIPAKISHSKELVSMYLQDGKTVREHPIPEEGFVGIEIGGKTYSDQKQAEEALREAMKHLRADVVSEIGRYRGFALKGLMSGFGREYYFQLVGCTSYQVEMGERNLVRLNNKLELLPGLLSEEQKELTFLEDKLERSKAQLGKPFPQEDELNEKSRRLVQLTTELDLDTGGKEAGESKTSRQIDGKLDDAPRETLFEEQEKVRNLDYER